MKVSVGISGRHVHLTEEHFKVLFGNEPLIKKVDLKQPKQFASENKISLVGPKGRIDNVRVLGPFRNYSQIEVSKTDSFTLGVKPPVRSSGDLDGSEPITLVGPNGNLVLEKGCIIASRHIHITPKQMEMYDFYEGQKVNLYVNSSKPTILKDVEFAVSDEAYFEVHLDTDDANASLISNNDVLEIII